MVKRTLDILMATAGLILAAPVIAPAMLAIKLASPGPALFRAERMGRDGRPFRMVKLRTMHVRCEADSEITAPGDARIFAFGRVLRLTKIDELPQLWNVLKGDMSLVGPRPEAVAIVERDYHGWMLDTLKVRPGITSPGAIFGYTHGDALLDPADPEGSYARDQLPAKLAIELAYIERANIVRDIAVMLRTVSTIVQIAAGRRRFPLPREAAGAVRWHDFSAGRPAS
jgi:lipopolysaccharide/colanic/teichoic acid biosynthesis glycosyltransferase